MLLTLKKNEKMKILGRILSLLVLVSLAAFYVACDNDNGSEDSETDQQIAKLNGTWDVESATFEGTTPDLDHTNMTITISGSKGDDQVSYVVSGRPTGPSAWPPSGTLAFGSTNVKQSLTRDDGVVINYSVTDGNPATLTIDFNFNKTPYNAKASSVAGDWQFVLKK
jgi:hypothetical protein